MSEGRTVFEGVGDAMRAIPGPTEAWADIVGHLAWPVTVLILVFAFRQELRRAAGTLARRFASSDVKLGPFAMTGRQDSVKPLAPEPSNRTRDSDDAVVEELFELMAGKDGFGRLSGWVRAHVPSTPDLEVFLNAPSYATERRRALEALRGTEDA